MGRKRQPSKQNLKGSDASLGPGSWVGVGPLSRGFGNTQARDQLV